MTFISFRRELLDKKLLKHSLLLNLKVGEILDIGGVKKRRGQFQIPSHLLPHWKTLNNDKKTCPDILCELPLIKASNESFEQILMTEVLEYVPELQTLIKECHRVLKNKGIITLSFPFLSPLHGDSHTDSLRLTHTYFEKLILPYFHVLEMSPMGGPLLVCFDAIKGEWITHGKNKWWQRLWWKQFSLFKHILMALDVYFFPNPKASTTGFWYVLKKI